MPFNLWKTTSSQDSAEAGEPIGELDLDARAIRINRKLFIKDLAGDYTVDLEDTGKLLVCTAALTISLPTPTSAWDGVFVDIYNAGNNTVTVQTSTTDTLVVDNDATADSVAWSTSSHKIGAGGRFVAHLVGSTYSWLFIDWLQSASGAAATIAT